MKKLIAIVAIMVVLVGVVFAAETHQIKIQANAATVVPAFQLNVGSVYTNTSATAFTNDAEVENSNPVTYTPRYTDNTVADTINFESTSEVTVYAYLVNNAKTIQNYSISFSDGVFKDVKRNGTVASTASEYVSPTSIAATANPNIPTTQGVSATAGNAAYSVALDFSGTTCTASATARLLLATAVYSYAAHTDIDPGTYNAYIVMTVSTT